MLCWCLEKQTGIMASLTSVFVALLSILLCCGRLSYISSHAVNHVEAMPVSEQQRQADVRQPSSFDKRRHYGPRSSDIAPEFAEEERGESAEGMASPVKRLIGLLRCSGWGPSCSWGDYDEPTLRSKQPSHRSSNAVVDDQIENPSTRLTDIINTAARDRRPTIKFQPFFTLTSGKTVTLVVNRYRVQ